MIRAVLDTNLIISALFWGGLPLEILRAGKNEAFLAIVSHEMIDELQRVLNYKKFANLITQKQASIEIIISAFLSAAALVEPAEIDLPKLRDPKDIAIIACAIGGNADIIVSGDNDLLSLKSVGKIQFQNPDQFLKTLSSMG